MKKQFKTYTMRITCNDINKTVIFANDLREKRVEKFRDSIQNIERGKFKLEKPDPTKCKKVYDYTPRPLVFVED